MREVCRFFILFIFLEDSAIAKLKKILLRRVGLISCIASVHRIDIYYTTENRAKGFHATEFF